MDIESYRSISKNWTEKYARILRKQKKIQSTWTSDCKIFIKLNGTPEQAKVLVIKEMTENI